MQLLTLNFLIYKYCGLWRPSEWSSIIAKLLYNVFTFIILSAIYFLMITEFMDIIFIIDNMDDFASNALMCLSIIALCCKATIVVVRRDEIINLIQELMKAPHKPRNEDEATIQLKFDKFIRSCSIKYLFLCLSAVISSTMGSVINVIHGHLPYRIWVPFDYTVPMVFWIISIQQIFTIIFGTMINASSESLVFGLLIQTCAQLEIFENRLNRLIINKTVGCRALSPSNEDRMEISECIHHHLSIYKYAKTVNIIFNEVLFIQFFASILVLCTSVYYLSTHITELSGSAAFFAYTICMFVQIYIYCWSGNEVILKSMRVGDAIYCMDWPLLSVSEKKTLLMIMRRSTIPIKFTSSFLITLSLQSYSNMLKTSYTAFNVLQK